MSAAADVRSTVPRRSESGSGLDLLVAELEQWAGAGRRASLWWRDDDAVRLSDPVARLLDLAGRQDVPLALAVIPAAADATLAAAVAARRGVTVVQHGYAHTNHEPAGAKKSEFGIARSAAEVRGDIARGRARLDELFGERVRPVFVPPWNRIDRRGLETLGDLGFAAVSRFSGAASPPPGLGAIDCHADIIDWHGTRGFTGAADPIGRMVDHLAARRQGRVADAPTGLLTHHAVHDDASWDFLEAVFAATARHRGAQWIRVDEAMRS